MRVVIASDDNSFSAEVGSALRAEVGAEATRLLNPFEVGSKAEAASVCTEACVPPLLHMADEFGAADAMILNSRSNVGSFLLSRWPAGELGSRRLTAA